VAEDEHRLLDRHRPAIQFEDAQRGKRLPAYIRGYRIALIGLTSGAGTLS
jgi:hypothetical protein